MRTDRRFLGCAASWLALLCATVVAAPATPVAAQARQHGRVERIRVHGASLEGNLSGDPADRDVAVYLPPSYDRETSRRYPVVYFLHGYTDDEVHWFGFVNHFVNIPAAMDGALADGLAGEIIIVMPNSYTRFQGSMYSNSITTGNWEDFVTRDLVAYIDANYRTLAARASRGLAGHSMGGYGALRIGMRHPDVYASVYVMSPCCLAPRTTGSDGAAAMARAEAITNMEEFRRADFGTRALIASAAAWAPNPQNPPFFLDLPTKNGEVQSSVLAKFAANSPLAMIDQYIRGLKSLRALAIDAGDRDGSITSTSRQVHAILETYGVAHDFEIYSGDHLSGVMNQIRTKTMPFFARSLAFER